MNFGRRISGIRNNNGRITDTHTPFNGLPSAGNALALIGWHPFTKVKNKTVNNFVLDDTSNKMTVGTKKIVTTIKLKE